jgi:cytochrome c biogenesis protein CcdA
MEKRGQGARFDGLGRRLPPPPLGWIGFFEPCSLRINALFLAHVRGLERDQRIAEALKFVAARASVVSVVGLSVAFIGSRFVTFQTSLFLGVFYILLGVSYLGARYWMAASIPALNLSKLV